MTEIATATGSATRRPRRRAWPDTSLLIGGTIIVSLVLIAIFADVLTPYDPVRTNPAARYLPLFTQGHVFGTDELGRDILSRLVQGARLAMVLALVPTVIALLIGAALGLLAGYAGGIVDSILMRIFDVMFAFPSILLALGISASLGAGTQSIIFALIIVTIPTFGRIVRGSVLNVKQELYVEATRVLGFSMPRIVLVHIVPNILGPAIIYASLQTGRNVILASSLSFLGLGPQPPAADWGQMLSSGRAALSAAPHVATIPGLAIVLLAIGFNLMGDGLRDILDPRYRSRR